MEKQNLNTREASDYLKTLGIEFAPQTLEKWRCRGGGPAFKKISMRVYYERSVLDEFAKGTTVLRDPEG